MSDINYEAALFNGGIEAVEGRYDTPNLRFVNSVNREIVVQSGAMSAYYDSLELLKAVVLAAILADEEGTAEYLGRLLVPDAPVTYGAVVKLR
jgi:hypothetical protein